MSRRAQPYRKGKPRVPGATLEAMLRGQPVLRPHPLTAKRQLAKRRRRASVRR